MHRVKVSIGIVMLLSFSGRVFADHFGGKKSCSNGLCDIFRVTMSNSQEHSDATIITPNQNGSSGVIAIDPTAAADTVVCSKTVRVPLKIHSSLLAFSESIFPRVEDASVTIFSPGEQMMLLMLATMMRQTENFNACSR